MVRNNLATITASLSRKAEERSGIKVAGLLKFMLNKKFIGTLLIVCENLPSVDRLSTTLQTKPFNVDLLEGTIQVNNQDLGDAAKSPGKGLGLLCHQHAVDSLRRI